MYWLVENKKIRELAYLQGEWVTCISYLKIEKACFISKCGMLLCLRRDAREQCRGKMSCQTERNAEESFQLEES